MASDLRRSQEALVRSEKQAAQGALVPMLAHNIRNPLASIRAVAQVADTPESSQEIRESFKDIIAAVDRLERWTGAMLAYLHPLKPQPVAANLESILKGALAPLQQKIREKSLIVDWQPASPTHALTTDQHLLEQTFYNLLLNAIDASPAASTITIIAETLTNGLQVTMMDCGPGMPFTPDPQDQSPGPTTKRFGTGLGIPFAFKVTETLGGHLAYHPRPGGGTIVILTLPHQTAPRNG
jgi:signal transduction histidine kinase